MCIEEMNPQDLKEAITDCEWQIKFYTDELKRVTNKLKTNEFLLKELAQKLKDQEEKELA